MRNQTQTSDPNLRVETKPPPTSDSKLSNPNESTSPDNKNISSLSRRCFLLARVCLGCGFACTGIKVDRELVWRYSDLLAQNRLEALELQQRVNEHASDLPMSVWV